MTNSDQNSDSNNSLISNELLGGIYIQMLRIYDVLCLIANGNPDIKNKVEELISLHESGQVLSPEPALNFDENE